jgi:hypothetical protein
VTDEPVAVPLPRCAACGAKVHSATTEFPLTDGQRRIVERMHPCECIAIDVALEPVHTGAIGPGEDMNALTAAWHHIAAAAEAIDGGTDTQAALMHLVDDVLNVVGIHHLNGAGASARVDAIRTAAEHDNEEGSAHDR